jgi:hypothetical protein
MITKEQLEEIGFRYFPRYGTYMTTDFEFEFDLNKQELWALYDGCAEPELIGIRPTFEIVKELVEST